MKHPHPHQSSSDDDDDNVRFADVVSDIEERAAQRPRIFDPDSTLFRGSVVFGIVVTMLGAFGGVWGIAIAFSAFKSGADNTRKDVDANRELIETVRDEARAERKLIREEIGTLRRRTLSLREIDLWSELLRQQNQGNGPLLVPKPSDFKVEP